MIRELKESLFKTNILDLVVTVVIGVTFSAVVTSLVRDVITPPFSNPALKAAGMEEITELSWHDVVYGSFLSAVINFLIVGVILLFIVKTVNAVPAFDKKQNEVEEEVAPIQGEPPTEIRGLSKEK